MPTISVGEAGGVVCDAGAVGATGCAVGALVCAGGAGSGAGAAWALAPCALTAISIAATIPAANHAGPRNAILPRRRLHPIQFDLIRERSIFRAHRDREKDADA